MLTWRWSLAQPRRDVLVLVRVRDRLGARHRVGTERVDTLRRRRGRLRPVWRGTVDERGRRLRAALHVGRLGLGRGKEKREGEVVGEGGRHPKSLSQARGLMRNLTLMRNNEVEKRQSVSR